MKRIVFALVVAVISSVACNSGDGNKSTTDTNQVASGEPIHLTKQMFLDKIMDYESNSKEWMYKGELPGIIDFYADWCRPCKIAGPILEEIAGEYSDEIYVYKVDTDKEQELSAIFGIQSIPAFLFVPMEGMPTISAGIGRTNEETKQMFIELVEKYLLKKDE